MQKEKSPCWQSCIRNRVVGGEFVVDVVMLMLSVC